jgi:ribosome-binding protein aMBF1 (putative translation factor)
MKYLLLIYANEADFAGMSESEQGENFGEYMAYSSAIKKSGHYIGGEALQPVATATTVRLKNGKPFIEMKMDLARNIRSKRLRRKLTQSQLARLIDSSQSRVAKMESADLSVSMDLLIRVLLALGASRKEVAQIIALESKHAA